MQQLNKDTRHYQASLADYCRTGDYQAIPGVKTAHVHQYRRLVYNVVDDMLQSAYPLTRGLLTEEEWNELVQEFFSGHEREHHCAERPYQTIRQAKGRRRA